MHKIAVALLIYENKYHCFPPAYVADNKGRPMHSWRVLILPFFDDDKIKNMYNQYDFSEPWNGPNNSKLLKKCPEVFRCPAAKNQKPAVTNYAAVVGPETVWPGEKSTKIENIEDGCAETILLVETAESGIAWTEPRDIPFRQAIKRLNVDRQGIGSYHPGITVVVFVDGHNDLLTNETSPQHLRAMLTIAGGENIEDPSTEEQKNESNQSAPPKTSNSPSKSK